MGPNIAARAVSTLLVLAGTLVLASPVQGQEVSARDRRSAGEAYDRGTAAYLAEEFGRAAEWFETAHRLAPASAALIQAVRSHARAGNEVRAASLALRLQALYPDDRQAARAATQALRAASRFLRVDARCEGCTIEVDGALAGHTSFFVSPNEEHRVVASFDTGPTEQTVTGGAGETQTLTFEAPAAPTEPPPPEQLDPQDDAPAEPEPIEPAPGGGLDGVPLAVSLSAVGVTAVLGAVLVWSGVDTLDGVPAYEADPTPERLADGQSREERTNWLIASTSVIGAASVLLLIFTDWGGGEEAETGTASWSPVLDVQANGVRVGLRGRY